MMASRSGATEMDMLASRAWTTGAASGGCLAVPVGGAGSSDAEPGPGDTRARCLVPRRTFPRRVRSSSRLNPTSSARSGGPRPVGLPGGGVLPLVAEHDHLNSQLVAVTLAQAHQREDSDEGDVWKRKRHGPVSSSRATHESPTQDTRVTFSAPTRPWTTADQG